MYSAEFVDVLGTKVLHKSFPPCYSQSPLPMDFTPPPPCLKRVCNVKNTVYGNLKSENSQGYAQKPHEIVRS
jgi:hypothetical protein